MIAQTIPSVAVDLPGPPSSCSLALRQKMHWGAGTSAYQIEGAWNADGKSPSIWDTFTRQAGFVEGGMTGNVACDHYHRFEEDVAYMKSLGMKIYRFSVAWTRIIPGGVKGSPINMPGVNWYVNLVKLLLANNITPAVTIYHWDLPQVLQDKYKGFYGGGQFQDDFVYYADTLFKYLGPYVCHWITFNEPNVICGLGYGEGVFAPAVVDGPIGQMKCGYNLLLAHAKTVHLYRQKYSSSQGGRLSMALDGNFGIPFTNSDADKKAVEALHIWKWGWIADPVYFGDWPNWLKEVLGYRLPAFTQEDKALLKGSFDYFGLNFYDSMFAKSNPGAIPPVIASATGPNGSFVGAPSASSWVFKTPTGLRSALNWLSARYSHPEFWVVENGVAVPGEAQARPPGVLNDTFRQEWISGYLNSLCQAVTTDRVNVTTYIAWSLMDNFEWKHAFKERFGITYVDLNNNLTRSPKMSALWLSKHFFTQGAAHPKPSAAVNMLN
eukprot:jgi/Chrzof1/14548/Cz09g06270.t1